jgi:acyl-CoA thioesterase
MNTHEKKRLETLKRFIDERDRFAVYNGLRLLELSPGRARVTMKIEDHHLNAMDGAHGGAVFSLADLAFAAASNSHGSTAMGVNASISYVRGAVSGDVLYADAEEVSRGRRLATYNVRVSNAAGECVALFQGTVYRREGQEIPPSGWEGKG